MTDETAKPCVIDVFRTDTDPKAPWMARVELPGLSAEVAAPTFKQAWAAANDLAQPALRPLMFMQRRPPSMIEDAPELATVLNLAPTKLSVGDLVRLPGLPGTGSVVESPIPDDTRVCVDWGSPAPERCLYYPGDLELVVSDDNESKLRAGRFILTCEGTDGVQAYVTSWDTAAEAEAAFPIAPRFKLTDDTRLVSWEDGATLEDFREANAEQATPDLHDDQTWHDS